MSSGWLVGHRRQLLAVTLLVSVIAYWAWPQRLPGVDPVLQADEAAATRVAPDGRDSPEANASSKVGEQTSAGLSAYSAMALVELGSSARTVEQELLRRADRGDTLALAALADLHLKCRGFYAERPDGRPIASVHLAAPGTPERAARQYAHDTLQRFCDRAYTLGESTELSRDIRKKLDLAASNGDPAARAYSFFEGEGEAALFEVLSDSPDPWIVDRALQALSRVDGPFARAVNTEVFANRALGPVEIVFIRSAAAHWYACEMGSQCGANHTDLLSGCLYLGNCGIGLDMRGYLRQRALSGQQYATINPTKKG